MNHWAKAAAAALFALGLTNSAQGEARLSPDVLILGDSQLTFGAGVAFIDLMNQMAGDCGLAQGATTGVIGVRSSTLLSWSGRAKSEKGAICDVDPKWKVNAGAYGTLAHGKNPFIQIGKGPQFQFCTPDRSPLQAVYQEGYYKPKLLIMFLMGNAAERWAGSPEAALRDARAFTADLPARQPCIFMTSAPPYTEKVVKLRQTAQNNIENAFGKVGRCSFVPGFTAATIAENLGNRNNFRRKPSGRVKDPFHPTEAAAHRFLKLRRAALCTAIAKQLSQ
jgi:hypothetical protein